ncbi:hypothetical protein [Caulobacter endophyticus]|uniref:hypothetical protein n=1 Tax=Caulobacter endophyticus TaxID=2172652 RepID=UPI0011B268B4|nr:hypothetical protein [Caulobacter endophyticus]
MLSDLVSPRLEKRSLARAAVPARFQHLEPTWIFELALGFGRASAPAARSAKDFFPTATLFRGAKFLLGYPGTFEACARERYYNSTQAPIFLNLKANQRFDFCPELSAFASDLVEEFEPTRHGPSRLKSIRENSNRITAKQVATKLGISSTEVGLLNQAGAFETGRPRGARRQISWFEPSSVEPVAKALASRLSPTEFSRRFHLPMDGVEQLFSMGLLVANRSPHVQLLRSDLQLERSEALSLIDHIRAKLAAPHHNAITLREAFFGIGGSAKPWGSVVAKILANEVPGGVGLAPGHPLKFSALTVTPEFSRLLLTDAYSVFRSLPERSLALGPIRDFGRTEVENYLNCFPRDVSLLILNGHLKVLGPNRTRFSREQVAELGLKLISSREIMWRWRISPMMREALPKVGIERILGPFWPRRAVTEHFGSKLNFAEHVARCPVTC